MDRDDEGDEDVADDDNSSSAQASMYSVNLSERKVSNNFLVVDEDEDDDMLPIAHDFNKRTQVLILHVL
jgi:hypothetical protein